MLLHYPAITLSYQPVTINNGSLVSKLFFLTDIKADKPKGTSNPGLVLNTDINLNSFLIVVYHLTVL